MVYCEEFHIKTLNDNIRVGLSWVFQRIPVFCLKRDHGVICKTHTVSHIDGNESQNWRHNNFWNKLLINNNKGSINDIVWFFWDNLFSCQHIIVSLSGHQEFFEATLISETCWLYFADITGTIFYKRISRI